MAKAQKTLSLRIDERNYRFLNNLAAEEHEDVSKAVRDLVDLGRVMLAMEKYAAGEYSLGRAADTAGVSISRMVDILSKYGIQSNLDKEDYLTSLENIRAIW